MYFVSGECRVRLHAFSIGVPLASLQKQRDVHYHLVSFARSVDEHLHILFAARHCVHLFPLAEST